MCSPAVFLWVVFSVGVFFGGGCGRRLRPLSLSVLHQGFTAVGQSVGLGVTCLGTDRDRERERQTDRQTGLIKTGLCGSDVHCSILRAGLPGSTGGPRKHATLWGLSDRGNGVGGGWWVGFGDSLLDCQAVKDVNSATGTRHRNRSKVKKQPGLWPKSFHSLYPVLFFL